MKRPMMKWSMMSSVRAAFTAAVILLVLSSTACPQGASSSMPSSFRQEFIMNYISNRFEQQVQLVKKNKEIIPGEIKSLIADAMKPENSYEKKMYLLDIANAMGAMYKYWHGDDKPLIEVETLQKMEIQKENERLVEAEKWKEYESFLGNVVMNEHKAQIEAAGLAPVIYPHWLHRVWFKCKVCHTDIFAMSRAGNDISNAHILEGKQCGVCHDGKTAFGAKEGCAKCHNAGTTGGDKLYDMKNIDNKHINEVAGRLGAAWRYEKLPGGKVPLDRFGFINWVELRKEGVISPIGSLGGKEKEEVKDDRILFDTTSPDVNNVLFDHKIHSDWIKCSTCHPSIFVDKLGANPINMSDMASGRYCGHCHGKVSFTFADCVRCHKVPKGETVPGALLHTHEKKP